MSDYYDDYYYTQPNDDYYYTQPNDDYYYTQPNDGYYYTYPNDGYYYTYPNDYDDEGWPSASYYHDEIDNGPVVGVFGQAHDQGPNVGIISGDVCYDGASDNYDGYEGNDGQTVGIYGEVYNEDDPSEEESSVVYDDGNGTEIDNPGEEYDEDVPSEIESDNPEEEYDQDDDPGEVGSDNPGDDNEYYSGADDCPSFGGDSNNHQIVNMPSGAMATISIPVPSLCGCPPNRVGQLLSLTALSLGLGGDYAIIHAEMHKTLGAHNFSRYHILSIQKVSNCCLWKKFRKREKKIAKEVGYVNELMLFHGSSATDTIVRTGFDVSRANPAGMFGPGLYFAEHSSKSNRYAAGYLGHNRKMLICRVSLGKMLDRTQADKMSKPPAGYHAVRGVPTSGGLLYPEYVVYHNDQAYPEYLVSYTIG